MVSHQMEVLYSYVVLCLAHGGTKDTTHQGNCVTAKACGVGCFGGETAHRDSLTPTGPVPESAGASYDSGARVSFAGVAPEGEC